MRIGTGMLSQGGVCLCRHGSSCPENGICTHWVASPNVNRLDCWYHNGAMLLWSYYIVFWLEPVKNVANADLGVDSPTDRK